ncbi:MAG: Holliday junction branch migration protein RuvA [Spirochaetales bacterium]|nr:Holliday junction branch migration protein RuvA [Spirochaetales bacterium]
MLNSIKGKVSYVGESEIFIDTGALEFAIHSPDPRSNGFVVDATVRLFLYLNHREDRMELYGFKDLKQREIFLQLISISGFGPKQAVKLLSKTTPENFIALLNSDDADSLATLPGIGKKTASKIILSLRGKLSLAQDGNSQSQQYDEISEALIEMGFDKKLAYSCVSDLRNSLAGSHSGENLEREILKQSIIRLNSR